jgi:hypothetical protein
MAITDRITLIINNTTSNTVICGDIACQPIPGMLVGTTIPAGQTSTYLIPTNDRVFCRFVSPDGQVYELGMTCPKNSHNSAEGCLGNEGLAAYEQEGTPVTFTYNLGGPNLADWNNGNKPTPQKNFTPNNTIVAYGAC